MNGEFSDWRDLRTFIERVRTAPNSCWNSRVCNQITNLLYYSNQEGEHFFAPLNFVAHVHQSNDFCRAVTEQKGKAHLVSELFQPTLSDEGYRLFCAEVPVERETCIQLLPLYFEKYKDAKPNRHWTPENLETRRKYLNGNDRFFSFWIKPNEVFGAETAYSP